MLMSNLEKEKVYKELIDSNLIPAKAEIDPFQLQVIKMLNDQNLTTHEDRLNQSEINRTIFSKLDDAANALRETKDVSRVAADGVIEIRDQFKLLNGKTSATILRVVSLEDEKKRRDEEEEKKKLIRQGMLVLPNKVSYYLKSLGKISQGILSIIGVGTISYQILKYIFHF